MLLGTDLAGKTVGIIGSGAIGTSVVRRLRGGFGVNVVYNDVKPNAALEKEMGATFLSKDALLKAADIVSIHVPLLPATRHLISTKELKLMKKTAYIVNTSRGPIVDEKALLKALAKRQIAGAGLDVYECEPAIDCDLTDTLELRKMENAVLTPHTASATIETRQAMGRTAAENILAFVSGKVPPNRVKS
jgi:lactate dehydrogenase-like 2-hydroxyacid dehydrogenase